MGVYLPNMEMPKHCRECYLEAEGYFCWAFEATRKDTDAWNNTQYYGDTETLPEWCPLTPVPPHGDLIDKKKLMKRFCGHCDGYEECSDKSMCSRAEECFDLKLIANTPTVIKAEEGET